MVENFRTIVFQYPILWFNCPRLLKQWLDEVLVQEWEFGSECKYKLEGKKIMLAVSAGIDREQYQAEGRYQYTMQQLLALFELTLKYIKAEYQPPFVLSGLEFNGSAERINMSAADYISHIESIRNKALHRTSTIKHPLIK